MTNRLEQIKWFNDAIQQLMQFCKREKIPIRFGEGYRPIELSEIYVKKGTGFLNSKHRFSLAMDFWITNNGKDILWVDDRYEKMGKFWESLGGTWGGRFKNYNDLYHFEVSGKIAK